MMLDWLTGLVNEGINLLRIGVTLVAIWAVIAVYVKTKALVPVLSAILLGGVAIWAVSAAGLAQMKEWIGSDATGAIAAPVGLALRARFGSLRDRDE